MPREIWYLKFEDTAVGRFHYSEDNLRFIPCEIEESLSLKIKYPLGLYPRDKVYSESELENYRPSEEDIFNWFSERAFPPERTNYSMLIDTFDTARYDLWEIMKFTRAMSFDDYFWMTKNFYEDFRTSHSRSLVETSNAMVDNSAMKAVYDSVLDVKITITSLSNNLDEMFGKWELPQYPTDFTNVMDSMNKINTLFDNSIVKSVTRVLESDAFSNYRRQAERLQELTERSAKLSGLLNSSVFDVLEQTNKAVKVMTEPVQMLAKHSEVLARQARVMEAFSKSPGAKLAEQYEKANNSARKRNKFVKYTLKSQTLDNHSED